MHTNELPISHQLVRGLITDQFPHWMDRPLTRVGSSGTVHAMYRLGDDMAVRLPRLATFSPALERECDVLPMLAPLLPLGVPELLGQGSPTPSYPSTWSIVGWIDGEPMSAVAVEDPVDAATRLGEFVVAMRSVTAAGAKSPNQRGRPLPSSNTWTLESIASIADEFDARRLTTLWETALAAEPWDGKPTWIHGDLLPANLIANDGALAAVIDFGETSIGNPTWDLVAGWWVFDHEAREAFRQASEAGPDAWIRARGWALSGAAGALAYYAETNPKFADAARTTLRRILEP